MPLLMAQQGAELVINRVNARNDDMHRHLESLGLVPGSAVTIVSKNASGIIINVKESRVALSRELASKVFV
ncbi:MAG: FeoA family protein [Eggerthellaceae bacterium]